MAARTMAHVHRHPTPHTDWCARDHRCGVAEHRSPEIVAALPGHGRAAITRVRSGNREYAEIRARFPLHSTEKGARWQLGTALQILRELLGAVVLRPVELAARAERPEIDRRAA